MMKLYLWLLKHPAGYILSTLGVLVVTWVLLTIFVVPAPRWETSLSLGRDLLLLANFAVILLAGIPPIAKWWSDSVERLKENKPIVFTDMMHDGYCIRNVGRAPAVNVFYLRDGEPWIALGSLREGESRPVPSPIADHLAAAGDCRHFITRTSTAAHGPGMDNKRQRSDRGAGNTDVPCLRDADEDRSRGHDQRVSPS